MCFFLFYKVTGLQKKKKKNKQEKTSGKTGILYNTLVFDKIGFFFKSYINNYRH